MSRRPRRPPLFPPTTLFRSVRIARRSISGTFGIIKVSRMLAPDTRQQPVQGLNAITITRRAIRLRRSRPDQGGAQNGSQGEKPQENPGKKSGTHGGFVRLYT